MKYAKNSDAGGKDAPLLGGTRGRSGRRNRQAPPGATADGTSWRNWRVSAGAAGLVMVSMALTGVVAIVATIQRARAPTGKMYDAAVVAPAAVAPVPSSARDSGERRDRGGCDRQDPGNT